ncbi:PREDICTED: endophilin-A3-like isoform X8 [Branchiostoma belcheri]|uniref:Endophilin-A3-like isoform X7 n=1 Tax=Branchiostoma belcheri TaxID=7741 RepID=A0A6P4ZBE3_BRABE|nr:PREDICTED: endophilin-A3-like isoform X7 [Branchiostoma belcheri]XP_019627016.1 PREDICTED: endophilin-A3-like isoform X8 [Branchiostoma belcheri]
MSLAGLKKQLNKANQSIREKIGGAEATKLDDDFLEMEKKIDTMDELSIELITKTKEYLQPNPASRARLAAQNQFSKIRGQARTTQYPQPEGTLGDVMIKYGRELSEGSVSSEYGEALGEMGETLKQMAEVKYNLDATVKQNYLDPLQQLHEKDIKEVLHHRKKLQGRRLDYDCKKRQKEKGSGGMQPAGSKISDDDLRNAMEKFEESKELAENGMYNLLESDVEQISQLQTLANSMLEYHQQSTELMEQLCSKLQSRVDDASSRPRSHHRPKKVTEDLLDHYNGTDSTDAPPAYASISAKERTTWYVETDETESGDLLVDTAAADSPTTQHQQPCCKALYDFEPENEGELGFQEGDLITLTNRIDENWFEGTVKGQSGFFPVNYVEVVVPLL